MRVSAALPAGVAALFFEAAAERRRLEGQLAAVLEAAGYGEVLLPILDYFEPYEPLLGAAARGRLYRFVDRGGEVLALRADFTPMLARLLAPRLAHLPLPLRLFYRGDVVRQQEDRSGRPGARPRPSPRWWKTAFRPTRTTSARGRESGCEVCSSSPPCSAASKGRST